VIIAVVTTASTNNPNKRIFMGFTKRVFRFLATGIGPGPCSDGARAWQKYLSDRTTLARYCRGWVIVALNRAATERRVAIVGLANLCALNNLEA
jgi:hypothetical protein